jgi:hypothetical protein
MVDGASNLEPIHVLLDNYPIWIQILSAFAAIALVGATCYLGCATNKMAKAARKGYEASEKLNEINTRALALQTANIKQFHLSWILSNAPILDLQSPYTFHFSPDGTIFIPNFGVRNNGKSRASILNLHVENLNFPMAGEVVLPEKALIPSNWFANARKLHDGRGYCNIKPAFEFKDVIVVKLEYLDPFGNKYISECKAQKQRNQGPEVVYKFYHSDFKFKPEELVPLDSIYRSNDMRENL